MNVDCLLLILDKLDFRSLLNIAEMNEDLSVLSADVYRRKFSNRSIHIDELNSKCDGYKIYVYDDHILIDNFNIAVSVLQHFGDQISALKINYKSDKNNQLKQIVAIMNRYCINLIKLQFWSYSQGALDDVQMEFPSVEDLSLRGKFNQMGSKTISTK